jgi:hypothetical protein
MELQSGFVLAVLIAAVIAADRLGGADDIMKRLYQVAAAVAIALMVVSATTAFVRNDIDEDNGSVFDSSGNSDSQEQLEDIIDRNTVAQTVHAGIGILLVVLGVGAMRRYRVLPLAVTLGGLLLLLFGGVRSSGGGSQDAFSAIYSSLLGAYFNQGSQGLDIAHFVLMAGGTLALLTLGYIRYEDRATSAASPPPAV